ncbi:MAG: LysM peptidoglycan-binding domain-containing protein [bacterium]
MEKRRILKSIAALIIALSLITTPLGTGLWANDMVYTIKKGDTLWDIAKTHMGNPYAWRKLWKYDGNTYIKNPHWIYPGNTVAIPVGEKMVTIKQSVLDELKASLLACESTNEAILKEKEAVVAEKEAEIARLTEDIENLKLGLDSCEEEYGLVERQLRDKEQELNKLYVQVGELRSKSDQLAKELYEKEALVAKQAQTMKEQVEKIEELDVHFWQEKNLFQFLAFGLAAGAIVLSSAE